MDQNTLINKLGNVDIYLLDQVMKNRYLTSDKILDAGCGKGRNLTFMANLGFDIEGCDHAPDLIDSLKKEFPNQTLNTADLSQLPYSDNYFNHIICNAVLYFAKDESHFMEMIHELNRVLKPEGSLFIRMTSIFGLESDVIPKEGQYLLPDGSHRFLLTNVLIDKIKSNFKFIEPLKTVNVNNLRCMSTLVLEKE